MTDFDDQWKYVMGQEFQNPKGQFEYNNDRIKEFLNIVGMKSFLKKTKFFENKICLDAGCGPGRWTYAMQQLGAKNVESIDISSEAVNLCKKINPNAYVFDIMKFESNPIYDFILTWGVIHHMENTRKAFSKLVSQLKNGGMLHIMVYNKKGDWWYDGFRGDTCVEKHKEWELLSMDQKLEMCKKQVTKRHGNIHGWFDAFNPKYNWSFTEEEIKTWFEEEGFTSINLRLIAGQININGILKE